jgi:Skp family chaperone for outer membrane proteins
MPAVARILCLGMIVAITATANVADAAKEAKGKKANGQANPVFAIPKEITLTAEQQTKVDEIKKEQGPKVAELTTKLDAVLTAEQKSARKEATAKNKADGKKGKEAKAAVDEAMKLTDEQKKQQSELQPEFTKLQQSIKEQINGLLTDEQKTHYKVPKAKKAK